MHVYSICYGSGMDVGCAVKEIGSFAASFEWFNSEETNLINSLKKGMRNVNNY